MIDRISDQDTQQPPDFSLVRNDLLFRWQRMAGLVPADGFGLWRRMLFWSLLAWLPIAVSALAKGELIPQPGREALLQHFAVQVRCLVAIPLFILAEGTSHSLTSSLLPYFESSGLVSCADQPRFRRILRNLARLRDTAYPWIVIFGLIIAAETMPITIAGLHELRWATSGSDALQLSFGGWWYFHVARAIFLVLLLAWLWRVILLLVLFSRISKLDLQIVPTHPDGAGGLGFIGRLPIGFSPVLLGISSVTSATWAHHVVYHGTQVQSLKADMAGLAIVLLLIFSAPYLVWIGKLIDAKKRALLEYGALVGSHGRLVRRRWIEKTTVEDQELLSAPELGPVADTGSLYEAVKKMRALPLGRSAFLALTVPIAIPMLAVTAIQIPVKEVLITLLKTLA